MKTIDIFTIMEAKMLINNHALLEMNIVHPLQMVLQRKELLKKHEYYI